MNAPADQSVSSAGAASTPDRGVLVRRFCVAVIALALSLFSAARLLHPTGALLTMQIHADGAGVAQWFYDSGDGYSERHSTSAELKAGENRVTFRFPVGTYRSLRFDPINNDHRVIVESMRWTAGSDLSALGADKLAPLANVERMIAGAGGMEIAPVSGSNDPQALLTLATPLQLAPLHGVAADAAFALGVALALTLGICLVWTRTTLRALVVTGMALATVLMLLMAAQSPTARSVHPDELSHFPAYQYYLKHWLPPAVDDAASLPSLSQWGYTYLDELDVVYAVAARVTTPLFGTDADLHAARLFQVSLWIILLAMAWSRREWALVVSVVLLSPQLWYIFSYFNADAFPFFLSLLLACLVAGQDNRLHGFLNAGAKPGIAVWIAALAIGALLISKRNYLPLVPAFFLWLAARHLNQGWRAAAGIITGLLLIGAATFIGRVPAMAAWRLPMLLVGGVLAGGTALLELRRCWSDRALRPVLRRYLAFIAFCVAIASPRIAWDIHVNGLPPERAARILAKVEARAVPELKPSKISAAAGDPSVAMAAHGVPLSKILFTPYHWVLTSFLSTFGVYGYMSFYADVGVYAALGALSAVMFVLALFAAVRANPRTWPAMTVIVVGVSLLTITASVLFSWVDALQTQGRYLFPIFVLLAMLLAAGAARLPLPLARTLLAAAAILSAASFAIVALPHLAVP